MTLWSRGLPRSCDKLKSSYLYYCSANHHLGWQNDDLPWRAPTHKVKRSFDYVVWRNHMTKWNHYISNATGSMATKLYWLVTYHVVTDWLTLITSHHPSTPCSLRLRNKLKMSYLLLHQTNGHQTVQGGEMLYGSSTHEIT